MRVISVFAFVCSFLVLQKGMADSSLPNSEQVFRRGLKESVTKGHRAVGYDAARVDLLGTMTISKNNNAFVIKDVYCEKYYASPGPGRIPPDKVLNVEHTWPQSKFGGGAKFEKKSDLHHLYPTDPQLNSIRGNNPFGVVEKPIMVTKCPISQIGEDINGQRVFEPPTQHKGNVARAIFYFSLRYEMKVDPDQEAILRQWSMDDPPDEAEVTRNNDVESFQGNRNPFIDAPELINSISDF